MLLDIKYTNDEDYKAYVGTTLTSIKRFLNLLSEKSVKTTLRQVIIPTLNDSLDNVRALKAIGDAYENVDLIELLPFRKVCEVKYKNMGIHFPLAHLPEPTPEKMNELNEIFRGEK